MPLTDRRAHDVADQPPPFEDVDFFEADVVEDLGLAFQAALLVRHAPPAVADAFCAGRRGDARGRAFGTLPRGIDGAAIVARALAV